MSSPSSFAGDRDRDREASPAGSRRQSSANANAGPAQPQSNLQLPPSTSNSSRGGGGDWKPFSNASSSHGSAATTPTTATAPRYPSANEDYIGSYYYGHYDHEFAQDLGVGPSSGASSGTSPPRRVSVRRSDVQEGVTFGGGGERGPRGRDHAGSSFADDVTSVFDPANPAAASSSHHLILASPEELQRADYFARGGGSGRGARGGAGRLYESPSSSPRDVDVDGDDHPPSSSSAAEHADTTVLSSAAAAPPRGIAFDSPRGMALDSPRSLTASPDDDVEAATTPNPPHLRHRSSADIYAMAGGDTSALRGARQGLNRLSKSVRRISRRVVDMSHAQEDARAAGHIRLPDADDGEDSSDGEDARPTRSSSPPPPPPPLPPPPRFSPLDPMGLRGRSLGFMGPTNRFRLAMARLLSHWWIEPLVLALIVANLVFVVMQSSRDVFKHPRKTGFFDYWEDMALLGVFCVFTVEVLARIVVSGLVINPPQLYHPTANASVLDVAEQPGAQAAHTIGTGRRQPTLDGAGAPTSSPPADLEVIHDDHAPAPSDLRRMSKSNTLDAWAQLGDSIKTKAQHALRAGERPPVPRRTSTMLSRMSAFDPDGGVGVDEHGRPTTAQGHHHPSHSRSGSQARSLYTHARSDTRATQPRRQPTVLAPVGEQHDSVAESSGRNLTGPSTDVKAQNVDVDAGASASDTTPPPEHSHILRSMHRKAVPFTQAIIEQRAQTAHYAYLRHSWNRVDFVAVLAFWAMFVLSITNQEMTPTHHISIFRGLSVLRIARLLTVTSGTSTILQSLKLAAPLLANVLFFTVFVMLLFSIIGLQSFKGSYRRSCVWVGDRNTGFNFEAATNYTTEQICGGWFDEAKNRMSYIQVDGVASKMTPKGYLCPSGSVCVEADSNPNVDSQSFDNILTSLLQVVIIISSNGWSGGMYDMIAADYFASALYFIVGLIFLNFWLANLFVAVITNTFATISAQTHHSAFAATNLEDKSSTTGAEPESKAQRRRKKVANVYKRVWGYTKFLWLIVIIADLSIQATRASDASDFDVAQRDNFELYITIALDAEIVLRFVSYLLDDDWRGFFAPGTQGSRNKADALLALITTIIQIPAINNSAVYPWLTIFQLQRFYRVIVAVPRMERLLMRVFGSLGGLFNMILFLLLTVGLAAIIAVQLFRGDVPQQQDGEDVEMTFKTLYNGYLAMYQVFSSENWNDVLFSVISAEQPFKQAVIAAIFICGWFLFANFIVLQMFIAVLNEGFSISDAEKQRQQMDMYLKRMEPPPMTPIGRILHRLSPYRWLKDRRASMLGAPQSAPPGGSTTQGVRRALDAFDEKNKRRMSIHRFVDASRAQRVAHSLRRMLRLDNPNDVPGGGSSNVNNDFDAAAVMPLDTVRRREPRKSPSGADLLHSRQSTRMASMYVAENEDEAARVFARERQLRRMRSDLGLAAEKPTQRQIDQDHIARGQEENPRIAMARAINEHPSFDKTLWLFTQHNAFRRLCQSIVPSAHGDRIFGRPHSKKRYRVAQVLIFASIVASVVVAGIASPTYRKTWYAAHGFQRASWFSLSELALSFIFFLEFFVKVVADGFAFTPNAYLLNPWNMLDLLVLASLTINVTTELVVIGGVSRFTRALKAFRALRLINLSGLMRSTFSNLIIGGGRFVDAGILAILYIIPYAVWGQNLFSGLLYGCTDDSSGISTKADCVGEYSASPSEWTFLAPRAWQNPTEGSSYSFDNFRSALLILFEIVSLEGWTDVMTAAMAISGKNEQPSTDATQVNALFFVIYNLIGAVFVLTLFVSVIIEGFQSATGAAFLSTEQRQWIDLKRLISRQRPSRRPAVRPTTRFRLWCFERSTKKHDWWSRGLTLCYVANLVTLCTQSYVQSPSAERIRDGFYLVYGIIYAADVMIRFIGLGWQTFRRSWWCVYDTAMVVGIIANTLPLLGIERPSQSNIQLQKVFLTASTLKLVSRHNGLNQLFKTALAGLPAIVSLLGLWLCLFLFFSIMFVEVFGLTKWGLIGPENYARNFSSIPLALIFLSMMSTGEGWNGYMHDYTVEPPFCTPSANYLETDCGSEAWAYCLFIAWNVTSMYIFLNMFTGTVVENFSYIFNLGGKPILGREDMRGFKKTWLDIAGPSNRLPRDKFAQFFRALPGKFDVRIYPEELGVVALREVLLGGDSDVHSLRHRSHTSLVPSEKQRGVAAAVANKLGLASPGKDSRGNFSWPPSSPTKSASSHRSAADAGGALNLARLRMLLSEVNAEEVHRRRQRFTRMWHEAMIQSEDDEAGLSFNAMLTLIAHYKLIDDDAALTVEELVERRKLNDRIDDRINLERVRGVMRMTYLRYRFCTLRAERRRVGEEHEHERGASGDASVDVVDGVDNDVDGGDIFSKSAGVGRPILRLDTSALVGDGTDGDGERVPPSPTRSRPSPLSSPTGRSLALSSNSGAEPSVEELERRASPMLESFSGSAWGKMMRRVSAVSRDLTSPRLNAQRRKGGGGNASGASSPNTRGGSSSSSSSGGAVMPRTGGSPSPTTRVRGDAPSPSAPQLPALGPESYYTLDNDDVWRGDGSGGGGGGGGGDDADEYDQRRRLTSDFDEKDYAYVKR